MASEDHGRSLPADCRTDAAERVYPVEEFLRIGQLLVASGQWLGVPFLPKALDTPYSAKANYYEPLTTNH